MKHPKTHINQINKDQTQRTNIKSSKEKTTNNTQGDSYKDNRWSFNRNSSGQKEMAGHTECDEREKPTTKVTVCSKDLIQIRRRNQKLYRQAKAEKILEEILVENFPKIGKEIITQVQKKPREH